MIRLNPYLNFDGNCEEAINFYRNVFGAEFLGSGIMKMKDAPGGENFPEGDKNRVMHAAIKVGNDILMASDTTSMTSQKLIAGNNNHVSISVGSSEEADVLHKKLSDGGQVLVPMSQLFFGYFGSLVDKFGIYWMVTCESKKP